MANILKLITDIVPNEDPTQPPEIKITDFKDMSLADIVNWRKKFGGNRLIGWGVFTLSDVELKLYKEAGDPKNRKSTWIVFDEAENIPLMFGFEIDDKASNFSLLYKYLEPLLDQDVFYGNVGRLDVKITQDKINEVAKKKSKKS